MALIFSSVGMVYSAETLNSMARDNWQSFASQQYFDKSGVFTSFLFSVPLILIACFILVHHRFLFGFVPTLHPIISILFCMHGQIYGLYSASSLLIQVKRIEFERERKKKAAAQKSKPLKKSE